MNELDDGLKHYGVKGMKWGVRKSYEDSSRKTSRKRDSKKPKLSNRKPNKYSDALKKIQNDNKNLTETERARNLDKNLEKSRNKIDATDKKALIKKTATVALGVAAVAAVGYVAYKNRDSLKGIYKNIKNQHGNRVSRDTFNLNVLKTQSKVWTTDNYITSASFERKAFTLPKGHTFHRLSTTAETKFRDATYSVPSMDDFNRYVATFRTEFGANTKFKHISFKASDEIKVPDLNTVLNSLSSVMEREKASISPVDVMKEYNMMSGGSWDSPRAKNLMKDLVSKGYSAIVDEMDAGVIGEKPLVIINPSLFTNKTSKSVGAVKTKLADLALKEIPNRK